jgi:hypothetical protein
VRGREIDTVARKLDRRFQKPSPGQPSMLA